MSIDIEVVRKEFNIKQIYKMSDSHTNEIYKIKIEHSDYFVLRVCKSKTYEEVYREVQLHKYLNLFGINCPQVKSFKNEYIFEIYDKTSGSRSIGIVLEHIDGKYPTTSKDMYKMGVLLGKLHTIPIPDFIKEPCGFNSLTIKNYEFPEEFYNYFNKLGLDMNSVVHNGKLKNFNSEKGLCHGDFFRINSLIKHMDAYMLDLEGMGKGEYIYDLAMACFGLITPRTTQIELELLYNFLEGYNSQKTLQHDTINNLKHFVAVAAIKNAYWRYNYYQNNPYNRDISKGLWKKSLDTASSWINLTTKEALR
ncbi:phosphotransferase [Bacillus thuringiensis]|uniref:phosphotransferase n=1 Tax=Bacillus thuringiensis TaxID=1428 RepID=UPI000BFDCB1F|nr:phosphotransferase [Bacillus thuringiensis]PGO54961.1 hypothetical protein CN986_15725 [Bacillus thuringiensis]